MRRWHLSQAAMLAGLSLVAGVTACTNGSESPKPPLDVVVNIFPLRWLAEEIGGDLVNVQMIEAEAHLEAPSPGSAGELSKHDRDLIASADANLFAGNLSDGLRSALDIWRAGRDPNIAVFDISDVKALNLKPGPPDLEEDLLGGSLDPHFWMDPRERMPVAVAWVTNQLISAVTLDAELKKSVIRYQPDLEKNAQEVRRKLAALDKELATVILKDCKGRVIVPEHPAFMYFAEAYEMTQFPVTQLLRGRLEPTVEKKRKDDLSRMFRTNPKPAFFYAIDRDKIDAERDLLTVLASEYGVTPGNLDSLEEQPAIRDADEKEIQGYDEAMKANARGLAKEFGCE